MKDIKQIFKKEDLIGKTIKNCIESSEFWISFTDDSFVILRYEDRTYGFNGTEEYVSIVDTDEIGEIGSELHELGLLTWEEYETIREEENRRYEEWLQQEEYNRGQEQKERELQILEELKKKYE